MTTITIDNIQKLLDDPMGFARLTSKGQLEALPEQEKIACALTMAIEHGHKEFAELLILKLDSLDMATDAIVAAVDKNDLNMLVFLLDQGININCCDVMFGATPLMHAAGAAAIDCVEILLAKGADPTVKDYKGRDAHSWADLGLANLRNEEDKNPLTESAYKQILTRLPLIKEIKEN